MNDRVMQGEWRDLRDLRDQLVGVYAERADGYEQLGEANRTLLVALVDLTLAQHAQQEALRTFIANFMKFTAAVITLLGGAVGIIIGLMEMLR